MKINRIRAIQELLKDNRSLSLNFLCEHFNVSMNTIRRDINELEKEGLIKKVYGGIIPSVKEKEDPEPYFTREGRNMVQKRRVARLAAGMVKDNDVIYVDVGTTTMHLLEYIEGRNNVTVVTSSLYVINSAAALVGFNVIATGGSLYYPTKSFVGPNVLNCLKDYNFNKIFMTATGISIEFGATNSSPLETDIRRLLMGKNSQKILLVDSTKFDNPSLISYCQLRELDAIVTDKAPDRRYREFCDYSGIQLVYDE